MKNINKFISLTLVFVLLLNNSLIASAHGSRLVTEDDECVNQKHIDGIDEMWYCLVSHNEAEVEIRHIPDSTETIKYYFMDGLRDSNGVMYTWTTDVSKEVAAEIKQAFVDSMKKWNNIYYYVYDENGNPIARKIINVEEGSYDDHNLIIYPCNTTNFISRTQPSQWYIDNQDPNYRVTINDQTNSEIPHRHYSKWQMTISLSNFYISDYTYENSTSSELAEAIENMNRIRSRNGAHELGHVLGLFDVDDCCSSKSEPDHHEELLMGYGTDANRMTNITYKDIAGVSITRGFHTDNNHLWMLRTNDDGTQDVICALCNGVRKNISLTDGAYEGQTPKEIGWCNDEHSVTGANMLLVATDGTRDFYLWATELPASNVDV